MMGIFDERLHPDRRLYNIVGVICMAYHYPSQETISFKLNLILGGILFLSRILVL